MRSIFQNIIMVLFSILVTLLVLELGLRVWGFQPGNPFERLINHHDEYLGYRMIPGMREDIRGPDSNYVVEIKSLGFEDGIGFRDDGITKPVHSIFIGDSFVWGYGVNLADSVSEQFERLTGKDSVNMGMTSWTSPTQYARLFSKYGQVLEPDYALFGVFLGNDFGDTTDFYAWETSGTTESYPVWHTIKSKNYSQGKLLDRLRRFLYKNSSLGRFLSDRINFGMRSMAPGENQNLLQVSTGTLDLDLDKTQLVFELGDSGPQQINLFRTALEDITSTGDARNITPIVFIIPTKEMVYQSLFPDAEIREAVDARYSALLDILDATGFTYIDLLPIFRDKAARGEQLYFKSDGHWNTRGHLLAATAIRDFIAESSN